jgi:hypothetical protein
MLDPEVPIGRIALRGRCAALEPLDAGGQAGEA